MHEGFRIEEWVTPQRLTPEEKVILETLLTVVKVKSLYYLLI